MKDYSSYSDQELWNLLRADDELALDHIFKKHYSSITITAYRMIQDKQMAEDLGQEVFYDLWRKRKQLVVQTSLSAYLRKIVSNKTLNYIRDQKIKFGEEEPINLLETSRINPQEGLEEGELNKRIQQAIQSLPDRCRIVFILSRFQDQSYAEIAKNLDISTKTVENQISKALKIIKEKLGPYVGSLLIVLYPMLF